MWTKEDDKQWTMEKLRVIRKEAEKGYIEREEAFAEIMALEAKLDTFYGK